MTQRDDDVLTDWMGGSGIGKPDDEGSEGQLVWPDEDSPGYKYFLSLLNPKAREEYKRERRKRKASFTRPPI